MIPTLFLASGLALMAAAEPVPGGTWESADGSLVLFSPAQPAEVVQREVNRIYQLQQIDQFGTRRFALLFLPGTYKVTVNVGFYTQVLGLGASPSDTVIEGGIRCDAAWANGNATCNFWRGAENLTSVPPDGLTLWAVSQASPLRRLHVKGSLGLSDEGWSSGGFLADSVIEGGVDPGTQQQWFSRNSRWDQWAKGGWNMVFVGDENAPAATFPRPPVTTVDRTPGVREKPFLTYDAAAGYQVFVPSVRADSRGPSWTPGDPGPGFRVSLDRFHVARPGSDTAETLNSALASGLNLLFSPGIYALDKTLRVDRPGTILLGLGLATLQNPQGAPALTVGDVGGVTVAGLIFDAGPDGSPCQVQVGTAGAGPGPETSPVLLSDLFFRVGGPGFGRTQTSLEIHSPGVIGDNLWIWRADHGTGVGWAANPADHGLVVTGAEVILYGLSVEHYQGYQTLWSGEDGQVYFYQSEEPYDVPDQSQWGGRDSLGFASYKVADQVRRHRAAGLGVYCYFKVDPRVKLTNAVESPAGPGVDIRNITTVALGGIGEVTHPINGTGPTADRDTPMAAFMGGSGGLSSPP